VKLHLDNAHGEYRISGYRPGAIVVNDTVYEGSLLVRVDEAPQTWQAGQQLDGEAIEVLRATEPEVLLLGTGSRQHFPAPASLQALYAANIGFEVMDTRAACRTFNILAAEGRRVIAVLQPLEE
jgi:uncharacterized protein